MAAHSLSWVQGRTLCCQTKGRQQPERIKWRRLFSLTRARRCFFCLCVLVVIFLVLIQSLLLFCYFAPSPSPRSTLSLNSGRGAKPFVKYFPHREWKESKVKTILVWDKGIPFSYGDTDFTQCQVSSCRITHDKAELHNSDCVLFSSRGLWNTFWGYPMPTWRAPHQVWVLGTMEAPPHTILDWSRFQGVFNWTMHYRHDADLLSIYGSMTSLNTSKGQYKTPEADVGHNYARDKTKMVAWLASNCFDEARRQRVVQELSRFIQVDTFGECGHYNNVTSCTGKCQDDLLRKYRFYLALENARCRDYLTEKFFGAFRREQIPISNADVHSMGTVVRGSYIQISDFSSIEKLAAYLKELAANDTAYNDYMAWRADYTWAMKNDYWCELCTALHNRSRPAQVYTDLHGWLLNDTCQPWSLCSYIKRVIDGYALYYRLTS